VNTWNRLHNFIVEAEHDRLKMETTGSSFAFDGRKERLKAESQRARIIISIHNTLRSSSSLTHQSPAAQDIIINLLQTLLVLLPTAARTHNIPTLQETTRNTPHSWWSIANQGAHKQDITDYHHTTQEAGEHKGQSNNLGCLSRSSGRANAQRPEKKHR